jgi:lipopolysaccharide export system permease protein
MKWSFFRLQIKSFDLYLLRELLLRSLTSAVVCEVVLMSMQAIRLANFMVGRGLPFSDIFFIFWGLALGFLPVVLPLAFLFSSLSTFAQFSAQKELLALQIMGHSPWRLARTSFILGGFYSVLAAIISAWIAPAGYKDFERSMAEAKKLSVAASLLSGTFSEDFLDMTFFAEKVDSTTGDMHKVFLQDSSSYNKKISISAERGAWEPSRSANAPSELRLNDGILITSEPGNESLQRIRFDEYDYFIDFQDKEVRGRNSLQSQSLGELLDKLSDYALLRKEPKRILLEIGRRFYVSLLCFLFAPLAFGLSLDHRRTAKSRALSYGILITLAYYLCHFWIFTYLEKHRMAFFGGYETVIWILMGIPTFITATAGYYSFRKTFQVPSG